MALKQPSSKTQIVDLLISDETTVNPFAVSPTQGDLENFIPYYKKLVRQQPMPNNHTSIQASQVWHILDFKYVTAGVSHQKLLIFKSDGKVYDATSGTEVAVAPPTLFATKPGIATINNRLHASDGTNYFIYDGTSWVVAGLPRPNPFTASANSTGLTGVYTGAVTWVVEDGSGNRIHESSRSNTQILTLTNQGFKFDISALTPPARATHWSAYISQVAGSAVLLRAATTVIATTNTTVTANPASTAPSAPIRNDPPNMTNVLGSWKNRLAARNETQPSQFWFSAFGEVAANNNGAAEESWPGSQPTSGPFSGNTSISDLSNEWTLPDLGEQVVSTVWFDNMIFVFSNRNGYAIGGDGSLLDGVSLRDFYPNRVFTFGAASQFSTVAMPDGLAVLTPERRLCFWDGNSSPLDIGIDIQQRLNGLSSTDLAALKLGYWEGNGRRWLLLPLHDRLQIFDFSIHIRNTGESTPSPYVIASTRGIWFSIGSQSALPQVTTVGIYNPTATNIPVLLAGCADGTTKQLDGVTQITGTAPVAIARTASFEPTDGSWSEMMYCELFSVGTGDNSTTGIRTSNPVVTAYYDGIDPTNPQNGVNIPLRTVPQTNELRGWLKSSNNQSSCGAMARRIQLEVKFVKTDTAGGNYLGNEIWELALAHSPKAELRL